MNYFAKHFKEIMKFEQDIDFTKALCCIDKYIFACVRNYGIVILGYEDDTVRGVRVRLDIITNNKKLLDWDVREIVKAVESKYNQTSKAINLSCVYENDTSVSKLRDWLFNFRSSDFINIKSISEDVYYEIQTNKLESMQFSVNRRLKYKVSNGAQLIWLVEDEYKYIRKRVATEGITPLLKQMAVLIIQADMFDYAIDEKSILSLSNHIVKFLTKNLTKITEAQS